MIIKTQAIALKISPFSETSHVVTWLTAEHGKIATIIKGAQRPRNSFLGRYDLFYTCELLFYLRLFQGLHIVKECFPLKHRSAFRTYWPGTACASYFAGLVTKIAPFYAPQKNIYTLLDAALDFFSAEQNPPSLKGPACIATPPAVATRQRCGRVQNIAGR
ncbi:MAG: DNA repair protein RecO, partial [Kiritimatiellia bacterium]|nr:DNA repair protein RecO [Kiritimatiellia bacterium]